MCGACGIFAATKPTRAVWQCILSASLCDFLSQPAPRFHPCSSPQVTGGGLPLNEVDCGTLESRQLPGVHVCGELLDVFGRIGGYNFYWAFVTGRLAGLSAAEAAAAAPL